VRRIHPRTRFSYVGLVVAGLSGALVVAVVIAALDLYSPKRSFTVQQIDPSGRTPVQFVSQRPDEFRGFIVHYQYVLYESAAGSQSPSDGKNVYADTWTAVDPEGKPRMFIGRYTLADGTPLQTIYARPGEETLVHHNGSPHLPDVRGTCREVIERDPARPAGWLPGFLDRGAASAAGLASTGRAHLGRPIPWAATGAGASPAKSFDITVEPEAWRYVLRADDGARRENTIFVEPGTGLISGFEGFTYSADGSLVMTSRTTDVRLELYAPTDVPSSVFTIDESVELCHG
jgi:hypothetical protein